MYRHRQVHTAHATLLLPALILLELLPSLPASGADDGGRGVSPGWLKLGGELRGRAEGFTGLNYTLGSSDAYYLHRLRLNVSIAARGWLRLFGQAQDSRAPGRRDPVPSSVVNPLDLHQAYVELGASGRGGWTVRLGRQELLFGAERLVGVSDWSNVSRSFDGVRVSRQAPGSRLDWFASTLVQPDKEGFDRFRSDVKLHGFYSSFADWTPGATIQPYFLWKRTSSAATEAGHGGGSDAYTAGVRALGPLVGRFDYALEMAFQGGEAAGDDIRAWAGYWIIGYRLGLSERAPKLSAQYDFASGDRDPRDRRLGTFDQLYPTNHRYYGITDQIGWRNMHAANARMALKLRPSWRLDLDYYSFWLADRQDFLYTSRGTAALGNPNASSGHVGQEVNIYSVCTLAESWDVVVGYGRLIPGRYLKESSPGSSVTTAYAMWRWKF